MCAHGAAKSVLAGTYFNRLAEQHGLRVRAVARGTAPDAEVAEPVRQDVRDAGLELCETRPTRLNGSDIASADVLVAFDLTATELGTANPYVAWNGLPALSEDFAGGKAAIVSQVEALVAELKARADQNAS